MIIRVPPQYRAWTWSLSGTGEQFWFVVPPRKIDDLVQGVTRYLLEDRKSPCDNKA